MATEAVSAESRFKALDSRRSGVLRRAREAADITIPSVMPPEGATEDTDLPTPYQSLGARGSNYLASKFLLTLFPPGQPFYREQIEGETAQALAEQKTEVEEILRARENTVMQDIESSNLRSSMFTLLRALVIVGNHALHMPMKGPTRTFNLEQYVVLRDSSGTVTEAVLMESVHPSTLPEEVRDACDVTTAPQEDGKVECDVFTWIKLTDNGKFYEFHQEINTKMVPNSKGRYKPEEPEYLFTRWNAAPGENYGRGLVEEYLGDLRSLEGITKAIVAYAAVASNIVLMLKPNATTRAKDLAEADAGDVITGSIDEVDYLQIDKIADFQAASAVRDELTLRLSHAFLLQSGTIRDAERVTAEEISRIAQELEDAHGGVYTVFTQELQLPIVRRKMFQLRSSGIIDKLPDTVQPVIVTGFAALGRGHELNRMRGYLGDLAQMFGPEFIRQEFDGNRLSQRFATAYNVDVQDLLKTLEEKQQDQQMQQANTLAEKAAAPVAGAVAQAAVQQ